MSLCAMAQENQEPEEGSPTPATSESEKPKSEVEKFIELAAQHGELILGAVLEDCGNSAVVAGLEKGCALDLGKPDYPAIARAGHAAGMVVVQLVVGFDGTVNAASVVSGHPLLQAATLKAVREARFVPWKLNGKPIRVVIFVSYNFIRQ